MNQQNNSTDVLKQFVEHLTEEERRKLSILLKNHETTKNNHKK